MDSRSFGQDFSHQTLGLLIPGLTCALIAFLLPACGAREAPRDAGHERVVVVGMDGMDPVVLQRLMDAGRLPNFKCLAAEGDFKPLGTSIPPQSPVAWSNVIAGDGSGVHEIYDFIHRDPNPNDPNLVILPYLSTSTIESPAKSREYSVGKWRLPSSSTPKLLRRGPTFWEFLIEHGVDTAVYRMPANYPAEQVEGHDHFHCLTGMGTPDLLGSYGEFTMFTPDAPIRGRHVPGGKFAYLWPQAHRAEAELEGPPNFLLKPDKNKRVPNLTAPFAVVRDPKRALVKITLDDNLLILKQGEWSPWVQFEFQTGIPASSVLGAAGAPVSLPGMVRFYVKQVHPDLEIFATPINIDPSKPANPISVPAHFAPDLARATGLYFTAGIPEHTPEIQQGALTEDQWLQKAMLILDQRAKQFRHALAKFDSGCLFYYFGTPDLISHIFWRDQDPDHPGRDPQQGDRYAGVIEDVYVRMDGLVGEAVDALRDDDTLIVMSDHGFTSFRWEFNLNTWLVENGYMVLTDASRRDRDEMFVNVDWSSTKAYGLGLNGLYVNQRGREKRGIVDKGAPTEQLLDEICRKLLDARDEHGAPVVAKAYRSSELFPGADPNVAPDVLVGYARYFRASWKTVLGGAPAKLIVANQNRWSGDHCIAADLVPGILVSNRKIKVNDPNLTDVGPTILSVFGIDTPAEMAGRGLF